MKKSQKIYSIKGPLTPERLFSNPPLGLDPPRDVQVSPDGRFATFLRIADDDRQRLDLWGAGLANGGMTCWLRATDLPVAGAASTAERAERERKRLFGHGITSQAWSADSRALLIEAGGAGFLLEPTGRSVRRVTPTGHRHTDIRLSPAGNFVSYVRDGCLLHLRLASGVERAIARPDQADISFGTADFLAQEEMHRFDGHWWSPDEGAVVFTRVDVGAVRRIERFDADELQTMQQRYPFAGTSNPAVELRCYDLNTGETHRLEYADDAEDYLARVAFAGPELILAVQNRAQNRLRIKRVPAGKCRALPLLAENSTTWINLDDNFTPIGEADYLWTSERDGFNHLFRWRDGEQQQLTQGRGHIAQVLHADTGKALVSGWFETPTERHLYAVALDTGERTRITSSGWHESSVSKDGKTLVDCRSDLANPGEIRCGPVRGPLRVLARTRIDAAIRIAPTWRITRRRCSAR